MISDLQAVITLEPKLGYWVSRYFVIIVVASLLPLSVIYWDLEKPVHYALMGLFLLVWIMLCYTYRHAVCYQMDYYQGRIDLQTWYNLKARGTFRII